MTSVFHQAVEKKKSIFHQRAQQQAAPPPSEQEQVEPQQSQKNSVFHQALTQSQPKPTPEIGQQEAKRLTRFNQATPGERLDMFSKTPTTAPVPIKTPFDVPELTPEQLKKMSVSERLQYAKDLTTEREYRASRGLTKGALSGATFGLSEKIPGLKPEEGEYLVGFGEFLGSALPITKLYNVLGKPLVTLAANSPKFAGALQSLARMTGFGLTGATYEGAKETIKTGEVPSAEDVLKYGAQWAAFDGALQVVGKAASTFLPKLKSVAQANDIPERQVLNNVMDKLSERKIDIEKDPEKAIKSAQQILDNYPQKMQAAREERITALKAKEAETEKKITESFAERKAAQPVQFTTSKGSTYEVNPDGTTTRTKAARPEHPGEAGIQPKSERTFYVTPEQANLLGEVQTSGGPKKRIAELPDGRIGMQYSDSGKFEQRTVIAPQKAPREGLIPVELFDQGERVHFGNKITEVKAPTAKDAITAKQKDIIEKRKEAIHLEEQAFEKKKQALQTKATEVETKGSEQLNKLVEKESILKQKLEEQKTQDVEKLRKQSDKEVGAKTREAEKKKAIYEREIDRQETRAGKEIETINKKIENAKANDEPTKRLENMKESVRAKADENIEKLKKAINAQDNRLDTFKDKAISSLESKVGKIEAKELPASARQDLERNLGLIDRQITKEKKLISESETLLAKEKDRKVAEVKKDAQDRLKTLQKKKTELEAAQAEKLKAARKKAYAERYPVLKVTTGKKTAPSTFAKSVAEPVIEATGQGARSRIEYPKKGMDKIVEKMDSFIEEAKTPAESLKRRGEAVNTAIFNALGPLEKLEVAIPVAERASTRIKLAKSAASEINSVLENGIFSNLTGNFEHGGLKEAYGDLTWKKLTKGLKPHEYSLEDLDVYRTSKVALRRQAEGKKTGIDTQKAMEDIARLKDKYEPIDQRIRAFQQAALKEYGKDLLGPDLIKQWNSQYYSPLYRVMEEGKDAILSSGSLKPKQPFKKMVGSERKIIPPSESDPYNTAMLVRNARKNDAVLQYLTLVTEGKLPGRIRAAKPNPISAEAFDALGIDSELKQLAETLYNQTRKESFTPEKNVIRGWKNGKPFDIEVPEEIYDVFSTLAPQERGAVTKLFGAVNRLFSRGISLEPRKFASIMSRDALSSLIYSRTGSNPISIFEALGDIYNGSPVYKEFLSMGGDVYASKLAERIDRTKKIEDLITPGKEGILVPFEKMGEYFRKYSDTLGDISLAVPLSEYKRALAKYGNTAEGRLMAAMEARRVTYDPTRKGQSKIVQELGNFVPFWNVSLQDVSMVGSNLRRLETWMKGAAAITVPTLLLKMANEGNPDYEDLTPIDKAAFWHIYSGDKHIRIPIPWLLGTAFKAGAEFFYDTVVEMLNTGDERAKDAWEGLYSHFFENISGAVPPALQIYAEQTTGKTIPSPLGVFFGAESKAPEVVPRRLQGVEPRHQYTSKTSVIAKKWGEFWNVSPVKVERFIKGLGTTTANSVLALTDEIAYFSGLEEDKRPAQREANYLLLGNFVSNSPPARTKYANEFYDYLKEAEQRKQSQKLIQRKGLDESLEDLSYQSVPLGKYQRRIGKLFKDMRSAEENTAMSPEAKKSYLDSTQREINDLYKEAVEEVRTAKAEK